MKSAVETVNPTRVRLSVEVPFEELRPSLDAAYRRIAASVNIPGFRKGKAPNRLIDQRVGRPAVLEEAVNEALPKLYGQAVDENSVAVIGQPEVEVTELTDGEVFKFVAEVDIRPEVVLPEYDGLAVTVDDADVADTEVDEQVELLRERFGVLTGVDRAAAEGDFVSIDLTATIGDEEIDSAKGVSYRIGSDTMLDGLDEAVIGATGGDSRAFTTTLAGGEHAGEEAEVAVTVLNVKERELPELDDEFAQTASEFDTLAELRADVRARLENMKKLQQGLQARDKALEALLAKVDMPLPEGLVANELGWRHDNLAQQLEMAGLTKEAYVATEGQTVEEFDADIDARARDAIKAQFVLEAVANKEQLSVSQEELTSHIVRRAARSGMSPDEFAQQVVQAGQVPVLVNEVVRGKALAHVLEAATVTDESGRPVDISALNQANPGGTVESLLDDVIDQQADELGMGHEGHDHGDHDHGDHDHGDHEGHDHD